MNRRQFFAATPALVVPGSLYNALFASPSNRLRGGLDLAEIHGKIQLVDSFPDFKVKVVSSFADLHVKCVSSFPNSPGKWQMVESFPDFKIQ